MEAWPDSGTVSDPPGSTLQGHLQDQGNENAITQQVIIEEGASQAHSLREADSGGGQQLKNEAGKLAIHKSQARLCLVFSSSGACKRLAAHFPLSMVGKGIFTQHFFVHIRWSY